MITWLELWPLETEAGEYWQVSLFFLPPRSHPQLHNSGPSSIGEAELHVGWPSRFRDENLLYAMEIKTDGPVSCRTNTSLNPHGLEVTWNIQCAIQVCSQKTISRMTCGCFAFNKNESVCTLCISNWSFTAPTHTNRLRYIFFIHTISYIFFYPLMAPFMPFTLIAVILVFFVCFFPPIGSIQVRWIVMFTSRNESWNHFQYLWYHA